MSAQKAFAWISAILLISIIADCNGGTKVLTRNWGPQSTLYLKGKHGRRNVLKELEEDFPLLRPISWINMNSLIGYKKSKPEFGQINKKLKLYQY